MKSGDILATTSEEPLTIKARDNKGRLVNPQIMMNTESPKAVMYQLQSQTSNMNIGGNSNKLNRDMNSKEFDDAEVQKLFDTAKKYMGMPYVFGGKTPETSFDCSGLVVWVYTESGFRPMEYRTAHGIYYEYCVPISEEEAKPGDLIFFEGTYNSPERISHVAIYAGEGVMFHAGDPIGFARYDNAYWQSHKPQFGRVVE